MEDDHKQKWRTTSKKWKMTSKIIKNNNGRRPQKIYNGRQPQAPLKKSTLIGCDIIVK
jgi:hypothetical protein